VSTRFVIRPLGALGLLLLGACASAPLAAQSRSGGAARSPATSDASALPAVARACPTFGVDDLEPAKPEPDTTAIALTEVFPRLEARAAGIVPRRLDLSRVEVEQLPPEESPSTSGAGIGWEAIDRDWVESGLRPEIRASFDALMTMTDAFNEKGRLRFLLSGRLNQLEVLPADADGFQAGCVRSALARTERERAELSEPRAAETATLLGLLEGAAPRTPEETYVLADLLLQSRSDPTAKAIRFARPLDLFYSVAANDKAPTELRARALEQTARIYFATDRPKEALAALEHVLATTHDDDLREQTLAKLAELIFDDVRREKHLEKLVELETPQGRGYPLSRNLGQLAQMQLVRENLVGGLETAAHCARAESGDFAESVDPWFCAGTLAEAMAKLGGAPDELEVPVSFLGPLLANVMANASSRFDRDELTHAAHLLLERAPTAPEAPLALFRLRALEPDPTQARRLTERLERDYGPQSEWNAKQVARLARSEGRDRIAEAIERLRSPPYDLLFSRPTEADDLEEEVRERLHALTTECNAELGRTAKDVTATFDTTGTVPTAIARGAPAELRACLDRGAKSLFRSLGPWTIRVTLHPTRHSKPRSR